MLLRRKTCFKKKSQHAPFEEVKIDHMSVSFLSEHSYLKGVVLSAVCLIENFTGLAMSSTSLFVNGKGISVSLALSVGEKFSGVSLSPLQLFEKFKGILVSFSSYIDELTGIVVGVLNYNNYVKGIQFGIYNSVTNGDFIRQRTAEFTGLYGFQVGFINYAEKGNCLQIGLINIYKDQKTKFFVARRKTYK